MRQVNRLVGLVCFSLLISACATIVDGKRETVSFSSEPPGAQIIINGKAMGMTPASIVLERGDYDKANVVFKKEGYQDQQATIQTSLNGWFWGNIILGGLIGSTTDSLSGAMWKFAPNSYFASLPPLNKSQLEMDRWGYETHVRKFILMSHERLAFDFARGEGEHLASLYELLGVNEGQRNDALEALRVLAMENKDIPIFAETVLKHFLKI